MLMKLCAINTYESSKMKVRIISLDLVYSIILGRSGSPVGIIKSVRGSDTIYLNRPEGDSVMVDALLEVFPSAHICYLSLDQDKELHLRWRWIMATLSDHIAAVIGDQSDESISSILKLKGGEVYDYRTYRVRPVLIKDYDQGRDVRVNGDDEEMAKLRSDEDGEYILTEPLHC